MTYNSLILSLVTFVYGAAAVLYIFALVFHKERPGRIASRIMLAAFLGNTAGIVLRWVESYSVSGGYGYAPLSNMYESVVFFGWTIAGTYLVVEYVYKNRTIGALAAPLACLALAYAALGPDSTIQPLIPALQSNWLIAHVITCFLGYAAFAVALAVSIMYLITNRSGGADRHAIRVSSGDAPGDAVNGRHPSLRIPSGDALDELTHQLVLFGFLFLTVGIITGAVWAKQAWTRYWSWDPKETWSLITWLIYASLLHFRMMRGWRGKRIAVISIIGFCAVLFTYFGVNYWLAGLHSYA